MAALLALMSYILSEDSINSASARTQAILPAMFRFIPHRALIEPKASLARLDVSGAEATAVLRIDGLVCSACAARVRRRLERVDGVSSARVDFDSGEARVAYDATRATPDALVAAVERRGALPPGATAACGRQRARPAVGRGL
jgi:copper chaperone CopZ